MNLKMFTVGSLYTNCYVAWCSKTKKAVIIDPGFDTQDRAEKVLGFLKESNLKAKFIIDTHGHPDHTSGNGIVKSATSAPILIHKLDANMLSEAGKRLAAMFGFHVASPAADRFLENGDIVKFGEVDLLVLHTPGHSPGSISLIGENCVFTGDTLFAGSIGRVDLPGGSSTQIMRSLREKLAVLPDKFAVYPGHGPESTIGDEKRSNAFLQRDFDVSLLG